MLIRVSGWREVPEMGRMLGVVLSVACFMLMLGGVSWFFLRVCFSCGEREKKETEKEADKEKGPYALVRLVAILSAIFVTRSFCSPTLPS